MVDLHTHILPGVDDGADSVEDALEMLNVAYRNGTTDLVLTPHYLTYDLRSNGVSKNELLSAFRSLKKSASKQFPKLNLYFGAEVFAAANIPELLEKDLLIPINSSRYILTEFAFDDSVHRALNITRELSAAGYTVVIAHPERYEFFLEGPRHVLSFLDEGALLQVNASSIMGKSGADPRDMALSLIDSGLAAAVASDSHSVFYRSPDMSEAYSFVSSAYSPEHAEVLFERNPMTVIKNGTIF